MKDDGTRTGNHKTQTISWMVTEDPGTAKKKKKKKEKKKEKKIVCKHVSTYLQAHNVETTDSFQI